MQFFIETSPKRAMNDADRVQQWRTATQQIQCLRDLHGEVIEGAPDNIRAVYYVWALCPAFAGEPAASAAAAAAAEDTTFTPTWRLMEMVVRGAHATI
jgi:hypothetical protein